LSGSNCERRASHETADSRCRNELDEPTDPQKTHAQGNESSNDSQNGGDVWSSPHTRVLGFDMIDDLRNEDRHNRDRTDRHILGRGEELSITKGQTCFFSRHKRETHAVKRAHQRTRSIDRTQRSNQQAEDRSLSRASRRQKRIHTCAYDIPWGMTTIPTVIPAMRSPESHPKSGAKLRGHPMGVKQHTHCIEVTTGQWGTS